MVLLSVAEGGWEEGMWNVFQTSRRGSHQPSVLCVRISGVEAEEQGRVCAGTQHAAGEQHLVAGESQVHAVYARVNVCRADKQGALGGWKRAWNVKGPRVGRRLKLAPSGKWFRAGVLLLLPSGKDPALQRRLPIPTF